MEKLKGESAVVLCGNFRVTVLLKNLEKTSRRQTRKADKAASHPKGWSAAPAPVESTTLDIRGLSGDEAVPRVERFIDAMHRSRMHSATIIHAPEPECSAAGLMSFSNAMPLSSRFVSVHGVRGTTGSPFLPCEGSIGAGRQI